MGNSTDVEFNLHVVGTPCTEPLLVGCVMSDGAIYAGVYGGQHLFAAPTHEAGTYPWGGYGQIETARSGAEGDSNTDRLVEDGHGHPAAQACRDRGGSWYLPASSELNLAVQRYAERIGGFTVAAYWSSTNASTSLGASSPIYASYVSVFESLWSTTSIGSKNATKLVRCFRH